MNVKNYLIFFFTCFNVLAQVPEVSINCHGKYKGMNIIVEIAKTEAYDTQLYVSNAYVKVNEETFSTSFLSSSLSKIETINRTTSEQNNVFYYSVFDGASGYLCSWSDCELRFFKLNIKTNDNKSGTGRASFKAKVNGKKIKFKVPVECELK